jgi:hypothetical protein
MLKKIFIISSVFLLLIIVFWGIYNFAFKDNSLEKPTTTSKEDLKASNTSKTNTPLTQPQDKGAIYPIIDEPVLGPVVSTDGEKIKYYSKGNGNVLEVSLRGTNKETLSNSDLSDLIYVTWSPKKDRVISVFNKGGEISRYAYDYNSKTGKKLDSGIDSVVWDNLGDKIIYKFYNAKTKERTINVSDFDGGNWKKLTATSSRFVSLAPIPQTSLVSYWNSPDGFEETALNTVGIAGGEPKTIFSKRFGADYLWSPNGEKALVSSSETKGSSKVTLAVINSNGGEYQNLNIPTLVSKCAWSTDNKTIYYALPSSIPDGSIMPNDYMDRKIKTQDTFWKVDIATGKQERLMSLNEIKDGYDANNLFIPPSENTLFFVNRTDGKLYAIDL